SVLVRAHPDECGMAQVPVPRPFGEGDFRDQYRLHPFEDFHVLNCDPFAPVSGPRARQIGEGALADAQRPQQLEQCRALWWCEARADARGEAQLLVLIVADDDGLEVVVFRLISADDEFLAQLHFELLPDAAALARLVSRVAALRDNAFESDIRNRLNNVVW